MSGPAAGPRGRACGLLRLGGFTQAWFGWGRTMATHTQGYADILGMTIAIK